MIKKVSSIIIGAGITGLAAGLKNRYVIYEANDNIGGLCMSYYIDLNGDVRFNRIVQDSFRFEIGGGHWIFGADNNISDFLSSFIKAIKYERKSAVYMPDIDLFIPYPLQNNLIYLPEEIKNKALNEILKSEFRSVNTMADWLEISFGKTLCELFFYPFHDLYTAGLFKKIAPQDQFKTPVDKNLIFRGAREKTPSVGYNATFIYPENGLDDLIRKMAEKCAINLNRKVVKVNVENKELYFENGESLKYEKLISTMPLNELVKISDILIDEPFLPYTSVLVINIGAKRGAKCPEYHWIYCNKSKSGFHRVGFYSNVDKSFLPKSLRESNDYVSIYVEKAFLGGSKPGPAEIQSICNNVVNELKEWKFIDEVQVVDPTWIEYAYTWEWPGSNFRNKAIEKLKTKNIISTGRYGKWKFQGIAESIKDGLNELF